MTVAPSCPALLVHDDDAFRRSLIAAFDLNHFRVTYMPDGAEAVKALQEGSFNVLVLSLDLSGHRGFQTLEYLRGHPFDGGVIIVGEANPQLRSYSAVADETMMKPVDPNYVAGRARAYCGH